MTTAQLALDSQAVAAGADDFLTEGYLFSGDSGGTGGSAIRFALPAGWDGGETISSAKLKLYAQTSPFSFGTDHKSRVRVLSSSSQDLPTTNTGVEEATGGIEEKTIGSGTYTPSLDYTVSGTLAWVSIDIAAMLTEAQNAGRLSGGWVVILIQRVSADFDTTLRAEGLTQDNEPTIDLDYTDLSPPPDEREGELDATLDDWTLDAEGSLALRGSVDSQWDDWTLDAEAEKLNQIGGLDVTLDDWTINAAGTLATNAQLNRTLDNWTLSAFGSLPITGQSDTTLDDWTTDATGHVGDSRQGAANLTMADWTIDAVAVTGIEGQLSASLDSWTIDASGTLRSSFRHDLYPATLFPDSLFAG